MNGELQNNPLASVIRKRRKLGILRLLCLLSIINGIVHVSMYAGMATGGPVTAREMNKGAILTKAIYSEVGLEKIADDQIIFHDRLNGDITRISLTYLLFYVLSTLGAARMYLGKKDGLFTYSVAQLLICITPLFVVCANHYAMASVAFALFLSAIFVGMYASQWRKFSA